MATLNFKTYSQLTKDIRKAIINLPKDIDLVVGIPRSGMIPAYMIGSFLNLPVASLDEYLNNAIVSSGSRPVISRNETIKKVLIVDDSVNSGGTLSKVKNKLIEKNEDIEYAFFAAYATDESKVLVDFYASICNQPRIFQWNYLYHDILSTACFDVDGVLCEDPTEEQNDDGERYIDFILNAKPLYIPNYKIKALVTSRLEKYREQTQVWLKKNNVQYETLYMLDLPSKEERIKQGAHGKFKAEIFNSLTECCLFVESERSQAIEIANITKKAVISLSTDEMFPSSEIELHNAYGGGVDIKGKEKLEKKDISQNIDYNFMDLRQVFVSGVNMFITPRFQEKYEDTNCKKLSSEIFLTHVKEGSVVVDIGAHYGYYSLIAAKNKAQVFSFEPVKENFEILRKNIELNHLDAIQPFNVAVSNINGGKMFNVAEASDSSSFYEHPLTKTIEQRAVQTVSLDKFLPDQKIDLVKIDTEGHELEVLEGMKNTLGKNPGIKLLIGFNPKCLKIAGNNPTDLLTWLSQNAFDIFFLDDAKIKIMKLGGAVEKWQEFMDPMGYVNLFCVKRGSIPFISFISHSAETSGAERSLLDLIDGLKRRGVLSHVVLPSSGPIEVELKKRLISYDIMSYRWWTMVENEKKEKVEDDINVQAIALATLLDRINPDVVYTNTSVVNVGALAAKIIGKPHVWHVREFGELDHNLKFTLPLEERSKFICENSERVIYNSQAVEKYYNGQSNKRLVVYNNVSLNSTIGETDLLNSGEIFKNINAYKLAVIGSVHEGKNQEDAIWAVKELTAMGINTELVIVGGREGAYLEKLKGLVINNNLEKQVRFLGWLDKPDPVLRAMDVLIVCSKNEAFGRTIVEAMLAKKPVIGTRSGGIPEIITDEVNGLLYTPGRPEELTKKLRFLFDNKDKADLYSENGYTFATDHFSDNKYSGKITQAVAAVSEFVSSGFKSLYAIMWETQRNKILKKDNEILGLIQLVEQKNQEALALSQTIEQKNQETQVLSQTIEQKNQETQVLSQTIEQKNQETQVLSQTIEQKNQETQVLSQTIEQKNQEALALSQTIEQKNQDIATLSQRLLAEQTALASQRDANNRLNREIILCKEDIVYAKSQITKQQEDLTKQRQENYKHQDELAFAKLKINQMDLEIVEMLQKSKSNYNNLIAIQSQFIKQVEELARQRVVNDNLEQEIDFMKTSKFWTLREYQFKFKFGLFHPFKFIKKYCDKYKRQ